jgi:hypothetical protein
MSNRRSTQALERDARGGIESRWRRCCLLALRFARLPPRYRVTAYEQALSAARAAVGDEEAFTAAWQEGRRMTTADGHEKEFSSSWCPSQVPCSP